MTTKTKLIFVFFLLVGAGFASPNTTYAQTADKYIWEYLAPRNISGANDLKVKLATETQKIVTAGHLAPFRALYGESRIDYFWYHPYDVIYTLSLEYPYLNSSLQAAVKTYLQSELQAYPMWYEGPYWGSPILGVEDGVKREPDVLPAGLRSQEFNTWPLLPQPRLFGLYALWVYARNTGDWNYIENNWAEIKNYYSANQAEVGKFYTSIAGAIGAARMAELKPTKDQTFKNTVIADINTGLTNGKNFAQFGQNVETVYQYKLGDSRDRFVREAYLGFQFLDISPEIGRYMFDDATLKGKILGTISPSEYSISQGEYVFPLWYMAQAPLWTFYFGEGSGNPVDTKAMIFPIKAWVAKEPATQLIKYIDVPDALLGDFYFMQNVVHIIEVQGTECWENILTSIVECPTSPGASPDQNSDGWVNVVDAAYLIENWGLTTYPAGDLSGNSTIDAGDLRILLQNWR